MTRLTKTMMTCATLLLMAGSASAATLAAKNGMTLYTYDKDKANVSACYRDCAKKWPPYLAKKSDKALPGWTMVERKGGKMQWEYDGHPLYFYAGDKKAGDTTGDGLGGVWHAAQAN